MNIKQEQLISATVPVLRENGVLLTTHFYNRMFTHNPELKNMFNMGNQESGKQQTALAMAVLAYAENIANPGVLMPVVDRIGHKHVSLDIRPEHYQIVGRHLIASIQEVLGAAATPDILEAWTVAYQQLATLMSGHETKLYEQKATQKDGWTGWRPFFVGKKTVESAEITSFYLYPADGGKVMPHIPGQYISIRVFLPELSLYQSRQYSVSSTPTHDYYRISVKMEKGLQLDTDGKISNYLHNFIQEGNKVDLTAPAGNFTLTEDLDAPVVLISGGVGLTPMMSMLQNLVEKEYSHSITWLHGCRSRKVHAFKAELDEITKVNEQVSQYIFYDLLTAVDEQEGVLEGFLDINKIASLPQFPGTRYYVCGPSAFIQKQFKDLVAKGIEKESILFEEFGPALLQLN
ncbi:NO-inducible flavohemoprotein [Pedobacter ginsengisoli]|uniref:Flavohemoprotein n=1 Tax=Pedobacter ginsengisoli TaxID=363852 RepID=A0A2D1U1Z3_9SPHI|nr:NO-inducible flavohemoprotein [Pedobacter ginsengisoli]ATP55609.1 NO-inducible flavohemoprotein [Pedobacter ginsengisoli]